MHHMMETIMALLRADRRGVTAVEYAIIAGVVALVIVVAFTSLGTSISSKITAVSATI
jgi:pilus assembly protein Flp/PilA